MGYLPVMAYFVVDWFGFRCFYRNFVVDLVLCVECGVKRERCENRRQCPLL